MRRRRVNLEPQQNSTEFWLCRILVVFMSFKVARFYSKSNHVKDYANSNEVRIGGKEGGDMGLQSPR